MDGKQNGSWMTAGQFAKRAGVTIRTIRFYDKIGLLNPSSRSDAGYRLYTEQDLARLQQILTLKYIGFRMEEIKRTIRTKDREEGLLESMRIQQTIIRRKAEHLRLVQKAIADALESLEESGGEAWERVVSIIRLVNREEQWVDQYQDATRLNARIRVHDRFSVNPNNWHLWLFEQLSIPAECRILELGCGDGTLWRRNLHRIPEGWNIILTDFSEGMLGDAKDGLGEASSRFQFLQADARRLPFPDESFDAVLANHMLYHVSGRDEAFREIRRVLRPGGKLYAATIGNGHLRQMKELLQECDSRLVLSDTDFAMEFGLGNGKDQLSPWFDDVRLRVYEDALEITEEEPLLDYIRSTTGNFGELVSSPNRVKAFRNMIRRKLSETGSIRVDKETGLFEAAVLR